MRRSAGILPLVACALHADAFLLPPGFTVSADQPAEPLALLGASHAKSHALTIPCSECAFAPRKGDVQEEAEDDVYHIQGGANSVVLNFSIAEDGKSLEFNGNSIFPLQVVHESLDKAYVKQVPSSANLEDIKTGEVKYTPLEVTGSGVVVQNEEVITPEGDLLIPVKHTIYEIEGQSVSLDEVSINLLKTTGGELYILHVETLERLPPRPDDFIMPPSGELDLFFPHPPPHRHEGPPHHRHKECKVLPPALCRLRNMLEMKINGMKHGGMKKPCDGRKGMGRPHGLMGPMPGHDRPNFDRFARPGPPAFPHGRPHHPRPHRGHHGHHHHHHHGGFFHSFSRGFFAVLIPTLAGIAVGMIVSLVGLVVGRIIGFLWIQLYRGGRRGYASVALDESSAEAADGEKDIVAETEAEDLPAYERPPAYNDVAPEEEK